MDINDFIRWKKARFTSASVLSLAESIPMITSKTNQITNFQVDFSSVFSGRVLQDRLDIVTKLSTVVVDVVQASESPRCVWEACLHVFVGEAANLRAECTDKEVALGEEVNVKDNALD